MHRIQIDIFIVIYSSHNTVTYITYAVHRKQINVTEYRYMLQNTDICYRIQIYVTEYR